MVPEDAPARLLRLPGGSLLLAAGLVTLPLPVPIGLPLSLAGLGLLVAVSPQVRGLVTKLRARFPDVSGRLDAAGPQHLARARCPAQSFPARRSR